MVVAYRATDSAAAWTLRHRMTIKDDLHALVDELDETDAREALEFLRARTELDPHVSDAYIADCEAAHAEVQAGDAVLLPEPLCQ